MAIGAGVDSPAAWPDPLPTTLPLVGSPGGGSAVWSSGIGAGGIADEGMGAAGMEAAETSARGA
jgi:hypothetical protein